MIFLFPRWDMLIPWRVILIWFSKTGWRDHMGGSCFFTVLITASSWDVFSTSGEWPPWVKKWSTWPLFSSGSLRVNMVNPELIYFENFLSQHPPPKQKKRLMKGAVHTLKTIQRNPPKMGGLFVDCRCFSFSFQGYFSGFILAVTVGVFPVVKFPMVKASCPLQGQPRSSGTEPTSPNMAGEGRGFSWRVLSPWMAWRVLTYVFVFIFLK